MVGREKGEGRVVWSITTKLAKQLDLNGGVFKRVGIGWKKRGGGLYAIVMIVGAVLATAAAVVTRYYCAMICGVKTSFHFVVVCGAD